MFRLSSKKRRNSPLFFLDKRQKRIARVFSTWISGSKEPAVHFERKDAQAEAGSRRDSGVMLWPEETRDHSDRSSSSSFTRAVRDVVRLPMRLPEPEPPPDEAVARTTRQTGP